MAESEILRRRAAALSAPVRPVALVAGVIALVVALSPPVDDAAATSLAVHMVQHVLLLTVGPPLIVAGLGRAAGSTAWLPWTVITHSIVLVGWHVPGLYDAADAHLAVHVLEHLSFVVAGMALWWSVGIGGRRVRPASLLALFLASFPGIALGSALTLSGRSWYRAYPDLADQQIAGVVMWAGAGAVYALACGTVTLAWLRQGAE